MDQPEGTSPTTACRVVPLFRPYRAQVAAIVGLIAVTSTIGSINPLLIQAVFNKALVIPGGPTAFASWPGLASAKTGFGPAADNGA